MRGYPKKGSFVLTPDQRKLRVVDIYVPYRVLLSDGEIYYYKDLKDPDKEEPQGQFVKER